MSEGSLNTASSASSLDEGTAKAIDDSVRNTFRGLLSDITQVIESRLIQFASDFSDSTASSMKHAVQKAKKESYTCKSKGNQQQLDHELQVLDKIEDATHALAQNSYDRAKECLQEGMVLITKRIKAIKLADKSDYGWLTVQEYLSDELASDSEDEKRIYRSERRAERRVKQNKRNKKEPFNGPATRNSTRNSLSYPYNYNPDAANRFENRSYFRGASSVSRSSFRLGPCFKLSIYYVLMF